MTGGEINSACPFTTIKTMEPKIAQHSSWLITGASATGKYHREFGIPCQDAYLYKMLSSHWGIAIVSDGAGSQPNAHYGSSLIVTESYAVFDEILSVQEWFIRQSIPSHDDWRSVVNQVMLRVYNSLCDFSTEHQLPVNSLAATVIISVFSENCVLSAHIGDGRMAILTTDDVWIAAITPFKGEMVGETVFITNLTHENVGLFLKTSVLELRVKAAILLTDGLENMAFSCYQPDENGIYHDPNRPFSPFLNALINSFHILSLEASEKEIADKLSKFLESGHPALIEENDDKTLIIATLNKMS